MPVDDPVALPASPEHSYHAAHGALIPQQLSQLQTDHSSLDTIEPPLVHLNLFAQRSQAIMFRPDHATSLPHVELERQAFPQESLPQSISQQNQQVAALNMLSDSSQLYYWQMNAGATNSRVVYSSDGFGSAPPWQGNSGAYPGTGKNTTGYTDTDMDFDSLFCDTDAFESSAGTGLDVGSGWTHDWP
jgi:hypothetical protein